jgi:hypothetical protein
MGKIPYIIITQHIAIYFAQSQAIASFYVLRHLRLAVIGLLGI